MSAHKIMLLAVALLTGGCGRETKVEEEQAPVISDKLVSVTPAQLNNAGIRLGNAEKRSIATVLKLNGRIDVPPQNMVSVSMPLGGYLKSTKLLPGMQIKKGEVIAVMEDQQYIQLQQEYLMARSKLAYAKSEYNRQKELNLSKASSDKIFQQTEMEYENQKVTVSALAEKLKLINISPENLNESSLSKSVSIYSTVNGFVSKVNVNIGKYVDPSDVLFELINPEDIHLNLKVFEKDLNLLSVGQKLHTYTNNNPDKKYPCEIILISRDLVADGSAEVHCHFDNYDKSLVPGMYMNAEVEIKTLQAECVSNGAIVSYNGKDFVFVALEERRFEMLEVETGASDGNFTQIKAADGRNLMKYRFVTDGAYALLMQLKNVSAD